MASRDELLSALRKNAPSEAPLPDLAALGVVWPDPLKQYADMLASVGGACYRAPDLAAVDRALAELPVYASAAKVISTVPGVGRTNVDVSALAEPRQLEGLDVAILPGELAVAENGAVWVDGSALRHRAIFFITQHLVLVVNARDVVHDMHQAYARLAMKPIGYGLFISGPSKTADIEQALVIGAQGARSCTVYLVG